MFQKFIEAKFRKTIDYIFGDGVNSVIPDDGLSFSTSRRTGRLRSVHLHDELLATMRSDGSIALTIKGAKLLNKHRTFKNSSVVVNDEVSELISKGRSVFAKHVLECGSAIRTNSEVAVMDGKGNVIAVGKAVIPAIIMKNMKRGVAVKVRTGASKGNT